MIDYLIAINDNLKDKLINLGFGIEIENNLFLHPVEYVYAVEEGYIEKDNVYEELKSNFSRFFKLYVVFKDLRKKGYVIRFSVDGPFIRVYRKGYRKGEDRTLYLLKIVDSNINVSSLLEDLYVANKMRKELVYAIVGDSIKYITITNRNFN